ncbi:membrane protein [Paenibacillus swuensis]|uniref:Membrane protein n=1 Tax=Paenibacillus swuensis TaxID=1178515 RepID=A0A172TFB3_9BACL|nr:MFS transporter [Paenibacillus swuensis]ANE45626.1 membrane protein [Paenibacillus swuensis]
MKLKLPRLSLLKEFHPVVLVLLAGTVFARAASSMSLPFLAIYLHKTAGMDALTIGFIIGLGSLTGTLGGFFGGHLSDKVGRKGVMLAAVYLWGLVFLGFALTKEPWLLALLNMLNGLCRSWYEPVSQALMADVTDKEKRMRVFSLRYLAINIGVSVGPLLGATFGLLNADLPWILTGMFYLTYGVSLHLLLNRFGIRRIEGEKKESTTLVKAMNILRQDKAFRYFIFGNIMVAIGYAQMMSTLSQYVGEQFSAAELFAWMMSLNAIIVIVFQLPFSRWSEKRTPQTAILAGSLLFALGHLGFAYSTAWWGMLLAMAVFTFGEILAFPAETLLLDQISPEHMRGTYYGAQTLSSFGHALGPWIGGYLLHEYGGTTLFVVIAVISVTAPVFFRLGARVKPGRAIDGSISKMQA